MNEKSSKHNVEKRWLTGTLSFLLGHKEDYIDQASLHPALP